MASKPQLVLLGYVEEQITTRNQQSVGFTVSKVGGTPDWCVSGCTVPVCQRCGRKQSMVVQIYAPLENGLHHRTLYIFACVSQECWNRSPSWTCLRSQILDPTASKATTSVSGYGRSSEGGGWFEENDDWGSNDNDGNGNADHPYRSSSSYLDNMARTRDTGDTNLNNMNSNTTVTTTTSSNAPPSPATIAHVAQAIESKMNIREGDANANEPCGAVGIVGACEGEGTEATAVIEGSEGDMIAVDTPEQPTTDIPALFQAAAQIDANMDVTFVPYFLVSEAEPNEDTNFSEHERDLLLRYTHTTGHDLRQEEVASGGEGQGDGVYEKDVATHGDVLLHKFKKRISRSPQQVLRYCREEGAGPLWLRSISSGEGGNRCQHCGAAMVFELQLTPQLVLHLRVAEAPGTALEFGTVIVFTCAASCWADTDTVRTETLFVQSEVI